MPKTRGSGVGVAGLSQIERNSDENLVRGMSVGGGIRQIPQKTSIFLLIFQVVNNNSWRAWGDSNARLETIRNGVGTMIFNGRIYISTL